MLNKVAVTLLASGLLLAAGCSQKPTPTVNASMTQVMSPQAQTIWDITSRAFNAKGDGLDGSKLSDDDWKKLGKAGALMRDRARLLAKAKHVTAAGPHETILGAFASRPGFRKGTWDAASPKQVQALIDANPAHFAERARNLATVGDTLEKAARRKDVRILYQVSSGLDEDCDSCHQPFWGTDEPPPFPR